jgi:UDP-2,3-diacylglucosamine hydrolase
MELTAPTHWRSVDFISDLHLQTSEQQTFAAWQRYLQHTTADALFILGDLFEAWVGDDAASIAGAFESLCTHTLRQASQRIPIYIMHGNRDFLMGNALMQAAGTTLIADPTVFIFAQHRFLLTHGDALCLADTQYQTFRQQVRSAAWQSQFLAHPLEQRQLLAKQMRAQSQQHQKHQRDYADVDTRAAAQWLQDASAVTMIHGHTHKPGHHALGLESGPRLTRWVLSDWDYDHPPCRADVLRIALPQSGADHPQPVRLNPLTQQAIPGG